MELKIAIKANNVLGEGPVWSVEENALYWVDIQEKLLQRWSPAREGIDIWRMPFEIGSFALIHSGGCVVALRTGLALLDLTNGEITPICDLEMDLPFTRFNDGKCDRQGRFWAGTMDEEYPNQRASLYRLDQDRSCEKIRGNVGISNGLGWSPDNKVFYYTDSTVNTIYAYDFDVENGNISNERIFVEIPQNYTPDGLTVDSDGFVWSAMWDGWKVVRFSPDGQVDKEIPLPVQRPTSCTFGGAKLNDLYITSARINLTEEELKKQPDAGSVLVFMTEVKGIPESKYRGGE
ncbi:hypothetical protein AMJ86_01695 [bacterium SM23_57]|jgi:L-arabinonolactonase|nr:MAG: hypothetical protein AMJ86_01695 [bacterium SM23_57]